MCQYILLVMYMFPTLKRNVNNPIILLKYLMKSLKRDYKDKKIIHSYNMSEIQFSEIYNVCSIFNNLQV